MELSPKLTGSRNPQRLGSAVGVSGEVAVVGVPEDNLGRGSAYVFMKHRLGAADIGIARSAQSCSELGWSASVEGSYHVCGASYLAHDGSQSLESETCQI